MPQPPTLTLPVDPDAQAKVRAVLEAADFDMFEAPHAFYRAKGPGVTAIFYRSGKLVLQGDNAQTLAGVLGLAAPEVPGAPATPGNLAVMERAIAKHPDPLPSAWIGSDETGKGDYFGPLVVVAARVERDQVPLLAELGVADSKSLGKGQITKVARDIRHVVAHKVVAIGPAAYNRLYTKIRNLNRLLAWAHSKAITELLEEAPAPYVLVDRFAKEHVLEGYLKSLTPRAKAAKQLSLTGGPETILDQRPKGEEDPAVACASILARAELVKRMGGLSKAAGLTLPLGAGPPVLAAGRKLKAEIGAEELVRFAKLHFKTTEQL